MNLQSMVIFILYQIIQLLILPLIPIYLLIRYFKKKPAFGNLNQRIGLVPKNKSEQKTVWIHAVSVGEILSIQSLVKEIKNEIKNSCCYVTTGTISGKKIAKQNLNFDYISFLPYDFLVTMLLAFKRIKPQKIIIVEAELWPNLILISKFLKIPIFLINARINKKSEAKYIRAKLLFKNLFNNFEIILPQSKKDKELFKKMGTQEKRIAVLGNIKALNVLEKKASLQFNQNEKIPKKFTTLLAGSIHPGEIDLFLHLFRKLKKEHVKLKFIIAPRHFYWKKELIEKVKNQKFSYYLWEQEQQFFDRKNKNYNLITNEIFQINDIFLVCKLGEMFKLYQSADIFFLGGTFVPVGGHNLLEPAVWSKPSIIGPNYQNCVDIANKLEKVNGAYKVKNTKELLEKSNYLLHNKNQILKMGNSSYNLLKTEALIVKNKIDWIIKTL